MATDTWDTDERHPWFDQLVQARTSLHGLHEEFIAVGLRARSLAKRELERPSDVPSAIVNLRHGDASARNVAALSYETILNAIEGAHMCLTRELESGPLPVIIAIHDSQIEPDKDWQHAARRAVRRAHATGEAARKLARAAGWLAAWGDGKITNEMVGRQMADMRLAASPHAEAQEVIRGHWIAWKQEPSLYKGKAAFARAMLGLQDAYTSVEVIERLARDWERKRVLKP